MADEPKPDEPKLEIPNPGLLLVRALLTSLFSPRARRRRRRLLAASAEPPFTPLPGRTVVLPGRGETFVRDSGGDGPVLLLLHGWMVTADLNWGPCYEPLVDAGYRVVAIDHRGHGRGIRSPAPFRLRDCADDAAAVVRELGCGPVIAVGYSMGGPITQLLARHHPDVLGGFVLCATACEWQDRELLRLWRTMGVLRIVLALAPPGFWETTMEVSGMPQSETTAWFLGELSRGNARDVAEAGRELGRFDSRPWLGELTGPRGVLVTTRDRSVAPRKQRELAERLDAPVFELAADHLAPGEPGSEFPAVLLDALARVGGGRAVEAA